MNTADSLVTPQNSIILSMTERLSAEMSHLQSCQASMLVALLVKLVLYVAIRLLVLSVLYLQQP